MTNFKPTQHECTRNSMLYVGLKQAVPDGSGTRADAGNGEKKDDTSLCTELTDDVRERDVTSCDDVTGSSAGFERLTKTRK